MLSTDGAKIQDISDAVGHENTRVTESVYRHVTTPEIRTNAVVLDGIFGKRDETAEESRNGKEK